MVFLQDACKAISTLAYVTLREQLKLGDDFEFISYGEKSTYEWV